MRLSGLSCGVAVCLAWLASGLVASASQPYNSADFVRNLYRKYLNREPSSNELTQWVWSLQKGLPIEKVQLTFLSSDAYFERHQLSSNSFIAGLFSDVLSRDPTASELQEWLRYYAQVYGDREKFVTAFLQAASGELDETFDQPPGSASASTEELVVTAQLLANALQSELAGVREGRQAIVMGRNLSAVAQALQRLDTGDPAWAGAYRDVQIALRALDSEMRWRRYSAPTSSWYLSRFAIQFDELGAAVPSVATGSEPAPHPELDQSELSQLQAAAVALFRSTQEAIWSVRTVSNKSAFDNGLLQDMEFFSSQVDVLLHSVRGRASLATLRSVFGQLRTRADGISQSIRFGNPAGSIVEDWRIVVQGLQRIGRLLGVGGGLTIDPGYAVLYQSPTYHQLPYQVQHHAASAQNVEAIRLVDQGIAQVDAFHEGFAPLLPYLVRVPELQAAARDLRAALVQLRQAEAGSVSTGQVGRRLQRVNRTLQTLRQQWQETTGQDNVRNVPDLTAIYQTVEQLNNLHLSVRSG